MYTLTVAYYDRDNTIYLPDATESLKSKFNWWPRPCNLHTYISLLVGNITGTISRPYCDHYLFSWVHLNWADLACVCWASSNSIGDRESRLHTVSGPITISSSKMELVAVIVVTKLDWLIDCWLTALWHISTERLCKETLQNKIGIWWRFVDKNNCVWRNADWPALWHLKLVQKATSDI